MTPATLALRYAAFAAVATAVNLAAQHASLAVYRGTLGLLAAIGVGTVAGLATKYLLDKRWIFADAARGLGPHARRFGLYTATGVFTTLIFWGTELAFHAAFGTALMRDLGAVIGLAVGYVLKYRLDRRFVFTGEAPA